MTSWATSKSGKHHPVTPRGRKTLFVGEPHNQTAADHISLETPHYARASIDWLSTEWDGASREHKVRLVQYANQAANRAGAMADNMALSRDERGEAHEIHRIYKDWVNAHKGKEDDK